MKIHCEGCTRQITGNNNHYEAPLPATRLWSNSYFCAECAKDLDENGNFPWEYDVQINDSSTKENY